MIFQIKFEKCVDLYNWFVDLTVWCTSDYKIVISGLCLEKVPLSSTSKYRSAEREEQILLALVKAGDLALRYLQEMERTQGNTGGTVPQLMGGSNPPTSGSPLPPNTEYRIGPILETALQRAPILYIKNG